MTVWPVYVPATYIQSLTYCTVRRNSTDMTLFIAADACMFNIQQSVVIALKSHGVQRECNSLSTKSLALKLKLKPLNVGEILRS